MTATYELHISDIRTFKSCRRRWDWSSPLRNHLEPLVTPRPFLTGKAVHYALATYYETGELPQPIYTRYMQREIEALGTLWPDEIAKINEDVVMGEGMLNNYMRWTRSVEAPDERWQVVATEMKFGPLPLHNPEGRKSNRIYLAGRFDGILRDMETGLLWLREFKTAGREPNPEWLELDDQAVTYAWAVQQIMGEPVAGVQFRFLMKKSPTKPPRLKNGSLSRAINSPQVMATNYDLYIEAINELAWEQTLAALGLQHDMPFAESSEEQAGEHTRRVRALMIDYAPILDELFARGYGEYFKEFEVRKTQAELLSGASDLWQVGLEMVRPTTTVYPAPDWLKCTFCPFRSPCKVKNSGGNYKAILHHEYRRRQEEAVMETNHELP